MSTDPLALAPCSDPDSHQVAPLLGFLFGSASLLVFTSRFFLFDEKSGVTYNSLGVRFARHYNFINLRVPEGLQNADVIIRTAKSFPLNDEKPREHFRLVLLSLL